MNETWKPIPGYEGLYEVSDMGRVRSLDQIVNLSDGRSRRHSGRILRATKSGRYWQVYLSPELGKRRNVLVHSLVLAAHVGPRPEGQVGRHLNDDKDDNRLVNLAYGTAVDNMQDALRNGTNPRARQDRCSRGHEFDRIDIRGWRKCSICTNANRRARRTERGKVGN